MMPKAVEVITPSRLHFGLLSLHRTGPVRYGGVGAMVAAPGVHLVVRPAASLTAEGPLANRARRVARRVGLALLGAAPRVAICIHRAPPEHVGLGTGTQLSMAIAASLAALLGRTPADEAELARWAGRGHRSVVGVHGFVHGGLIWDPGDAAAGERAPPVHRLALPAAWRFILLRPHGLRGLWGQRERQAFARLARMPAAHVTTLRREAAEVLWPAAARGDFETFSESVYRYGYQAGMNFAAAQGGPFSAPRLEALVNHIRRLGVRGVGQSSWGPTLFALLPDEASACHFVQRLRALPETEDLQLCIAPPDNEGAKVRLIET